MSQYLPSDFLSRMKDMLGEEYPSFLESYHTPPMLGLRVNTKKISTEEFLKISPFSLTPVPWVENGFFYEAGTQPSRHPYYSGGLYYLQEPSAMTPASRLPLQPGDCVLDLCAAPGGKATELGARLQGKGLLVANDISASRARALLRNLELCGIENALVTNETPVRLAGFFPEFFDKILVDAPCSGEGMFRKDSDVAKAWDKDKPAYFAKLQREILDRAVSMLKPGGMLLYSTCTFSAEENEGSISYLLENFPEMKLTDLEWYPGFSSGRPEWGNQDPALKKCARIFPHKMEGEGHFLALLKKEGEPVSGLDLPPTIRKTEKSTRKLLESFFSSVLTPYDPQRIEVRGQNVYYLPELDTGILKGIKFLRNGLFLGELKKNRFEPAQPLAMNLHADSCASVLRLSPDDQRLSRYLRGETLVLSEEEIQGLSGWSLVCAGDFPLGFGKLTGNLMKNKYPAGWRRQ